MGTSRTDPNTPAARRRALSTRDRRLGGLAARQHGVVTRAQLHGLGFSDRQIGSRAKRSLWPRGTDVFAVGHPGVSRMGRAVGALLVTGDASALSHATAARLWGLHSRSTAGPIHVSVLHQRQLVLPSDVVVHRPTSLQASDLATRLGLRLTTPERTLVDLLPTSSIAQTTRMLEQMVTTLGRSPDDLHAWGHGLAGVTGTRKLHRALDEVAGPAVIRSEFESLFRSICQEHGIPQARTNHHMVGWEVDAAWLDERVAVELDSWRWHGGKWQFFQDRRKGLDISRAGFELLRITWPQLKYETHRVVEAIQYALARGAARSR